MRFGTFVPRVQVLLAMWSDDEAVLKGEHYVVDGAINRPRPLQQPHPPLWIAARRRSTAPEEFSEEHFAVTVSQAVDTMGQYEAEGCTDIQLYFYDMGEDDSLELFASEVILQLR